ncbi:MAG: peptidoglycan DD-metalloendopeptidase family protein [Gemmatimonadota bacterium]|nr:peptidoglycan DD-metalloendopeptidase family protein [Gemmatimonadota bacterium]
MTKDLKDYYPHRSRSGKTTPANSRRAKKNPAPVFALAAILMLAVTIVLSAALSHRGQKGSPVELPSGTESVRPGLADDSTGEGTAALLPPDEAKASTPVVRQCRDKVRKGDTFETVLKRNGARRELLPPMMQAAKKLHNLNRVVIGHDLNFRFLNDSLAGLDYEINEDRTLVLARIDSTLWSAEIKQTEYQVIERGLGGTITSSLYQTVMETSGLPELALKLSEVYAWQIDFHSEVRKGDYFKVIYKEKIHPRGSKKVGEIIAAVFHNRQKDFFAIEFTGAEEQKDYFDLEGKSLRRAFLRSPFKYMPRVSSRYTRRRFHPILKIYRPHLGVDYAAPTGTPVLALGDGRVTSRRWNGGYGKHIVIKHNGMYKTGYGHLSRYARELKVGNWVRQGQVIGYVGSTGLSTGPHLDFRFFKNGNPVNPLKVDIPAGDPVDKSLLEDYRACRDRYLRCLEAINSGPSNDSGSSEITLRYEAPSINSPLLPGSAE